MPYAQAVTSLSGEPQTTFSDLGLRDSLLRALTAQGYEEPTPIQAAAIPVLKTGSDVVGQAATGTGKTAAFALPILDGLNHSGDDRKPKALVLVPTRELALQVSQAFHAYGRDLGARLVAVYGGAPARHQIDALKRGVDVVVATPGRALDLIDRKALKLDAVRTVVLDEADEMLEMGFIEDIESILALTPADRQTVLFSATMPKRIAALADRHLRDPQRISIASKESVADEVPRVRQTSYVVTRNTKPAALGRVLDAEDPKAAIVFCRTRGGVDELTDQLKAQGYQAEALHGGLTQEQRDRVMGRLRSGATEILVATDVAARGLDVDRLTHVVNYDLPVSPEAYVHRIGRVGRAGREGVAISLVEPRERRLLAAIEKLLRGRIPTAPIPTAADVRSMRLQRTSDAIGSLLVDDLARERLESYRDAVEGLLDENDVLDVVLAAFAFAHEATQGVAGDDGDIDFNPPQEPKAKTGKKGRDKDRFDGPDKNGKNKKKNRLDVPTERLFVSVGRRSGVTPADIVGALTGETDLKGRDIGVITVHDSYSLVEVPDKLARKAIKDLNRCTIKGNRVKVRLDRGR